MKVWVMVLVKVQGDGDSSRVALHDYTVEILVFYGCAVAAAAPGITFPYVVIKSWQVSIFKIFSKSSFSADLPVESRASLTRVTFWVQLGKWAWEEGFWYF